MINQQERGKREYFIFWITIIILCGWNVQHYFDALEYLWIYCVPVLLCDLVLHAVIQCLESFYDEEGGSFVEQWNSGHEFRIPILDVLGYPVDVQSKLGAEEFHLADLVDEEEPLRLGQDRRGDAIKVLHVHPVLA